MKNTTPAGIIFDLDGTLLNTLDDITASLNHALACIGRPQVLREEVRRMVGEGLPALIIKALGVDEPALRDRLISEYTRHHELHYRDHTVPYPGVIEMLNRLSEAHHPLAVLSNKPDRVTCKVVSELLPEWRFVAVFGPMETRLRKPDPDGALEIARRMERLPSRMFLIGDSLPDIETARSAGMRSIAVTWGFRDRAELQAAGPDRIVDDPSQILDMIST